MVDAGLRAVRRLWDGGLAHRDVKPANVLVRDGGVVMIDTGFSAVRPEPVASGRRPGEHDALPGAAHRRARVYEQARSYFTEDEIAEAFAASQGPTVPSQLRAMLKADGRDLLGELRALAPPTTAHPDPAVERAASRR